MKRILLATVLAVATILPAKAATITEFTADAVRRDTGAIVQVRSVKIRGDIVYGDYERFSAIASTLPANSYVVLESTGGTTFPALAIGMMIRRKQLRTVVDEKAACVSACALIWAAGTVRYIHPTAAVGFHASYDVRTGRESGAGNAAVGAYLRDLGYSLDAIMWATSAAPNTALWMSSATAKYIDWRNTVQIR